MTPCTTRPTASFRRLVFAAAAVAALGVVPMVATAQDAAPAAPGAKPAAPQPIALGSSIPAADTRMKNIDGKEMSIADAIGRKGTMVIFTCNACPWVKRWETRIARLGNDAPKRGIGVIAINSNDPSKSAEDSYDEMQKRARARGMKFPYVVDATSDVARAFGASRTPEVFLFDADGRLVYHGAIDDNAESESKVKSTYLADAIQAVGDGKAVAVAETKALGCTIKFRPKAAR